MPGGRGGRPAAAATMPCPSPVVWAPPDGLEALAASLGIGFDRATAGMALLDLDGRVVRANRPLRELVGRTSLAGRNMLSLVRRDDRAELVGGVAAALASGADAALRPGHRCVLVGRRGTGHAVEVAVAVTVLRDGYGEALALLVECHQEGGRAAALERAERERRSLLRQLVTAQEDERRRLAANLHDDTIQALAAALLLLDVLDARVDRAALGEDAVGGADAWDVVRFTAERIRRNVEHGLQSARTFLFDLRPPELDEGGLEAALRRQLDRLAERAGCAVALHWAPVGALDRDRETILFRAVQEALANVARHAGATTASIRAWREGGTVAVEVADDGVGFDAVELLAGAPAAGHLGLRFMAERIGGAGGTLRIDAAPGKGTVVRLRLPAGTAPPRPGGA
ncbi:MAG TPA: ATP-binding protein [Actinomycetes bacterium]